MRFRAICLFLVIGAAVVGCAKPQQPAATKPKTVDVLADEGVAHYVDGKPVSATLRLSRARVRRGETVDVTVMLNVAAMWEIRPLEAAAPAIATRLELKLPAGWESPQTWHSPEPRRSVAADGHRAYSGEILFNRAVLVGAEAQAGKINVACRVTYQACDEKQCLPPASVDLAVAVNVEE
jgi:hypothetical protein